MAYLAAAKISPCEILDFKISSLAKIDFLKITLNSCGFKMYRFYSTLIECKNAFLVLLLILMNSFCHFKQKGHQSFKYRKFDGSVGKCQWYAEFVETLGSDSDMDCQTPFSFANLEHISSSSKNGKLSSVIKRNF